MSEYERLKAQKDEIVKREHDKIYAQGYAAGVAAERERLLNTVTELDVPFAEGVQGEHGQGYLDALRDFRNAVRDGPPVAARSQAPAAGDGETR